MLKYTVAIPTRGSVYGDSRIPDDIGAGYVYGNCPAVGDCAYDGRHAKNGRVERCKSGKVVEFGISPTFHVRLGGELFSRRNAA